ncbi:MAG: hypothetical protein L0099_14920 [Acidobacteria bacterium]|nr:hypothetical protein [Acidobacteriota bacterium]
MKHARSMPNSVKQRIMRRAASGERALVLVIRNGKPSRVFGFEEYLKRKALTKKVRPWEARRRKSTLDPLGAWHLGDLGSLRREDIYE